MSAPRSFARRPGDADAWVRAEGPAGVGPGAPPGAVPAPLAIDGGDARLGADPAATARLTLDVSPALRARIKITAFRRGLTMAAMLRSLLEASFPDLDEPFGGANQDGLGDTDRTKPGGGS